MRQINHVNITDKEYINLLSDTSNYAQKINELRELQQSINSKIEIANTVIKAENLENRAQAMLQEAETRMADALKKQAEQKNIVAQNTKEIKRAGIALEEREKCLQNDLKKLTSGRDNLQADIIRFEKAKEGSESELKKDLELYDERRALLEKKQKSLSAICNKIIDDVHSL